MGRLQAEKATSSHPRRALQAIMRQAVMLEVTGMLWEAELALRKVGLPLLAHRGYRGFRIFRFFCFL